VEQQGNTQTANGKTKRRRAVKPLEELSYEEAQVRYKGKLALIRPTEVNEHRQWTRCEILAVGSRSKLFRILAGLINTEPKPAYPYQLFTGGVWFRSFEDAAKQEHSPEEIDLMLAEFLGPRRSAPAR
jgi:hypothetical protein